MNVARFAVRCMLALASGGMTASAQSAVTPFDRLPLGAHGVGFRRIPLGDTEGRIVHLWYPTARRDSTCFTFADYLRAESAAPDAESAARERVSQVFGAIDNTVWNTVVSQQFRGCGDMPAASGKHPLLVSMYAPGNWTIHGEYFASHGYVVATVTHVGSRPPPGDMTAFVATQIDRQATSIETLVRRLGSEAFVDTTRVGVLGQSPSTFLFAMRNAGLVDAVSLQDSDIFSPGLSPNALRLAPGWRAEAMRVPFLHVINSDALPGESLRQELQDMRGSQRYRMVLSVPHSGHEDLTGASYVVRRAIDAPAGAPLTAAFEAMVRVQHAFFDAHVRGDTKVRAALNPANPALVSPAVGRIEVIAAERR